MPVGDRIKFELWLDWMNFCLIERYSNKHSIKFILIHRLGAANVGIDF